MDRPTALEVVDGFDLSGRVCLVTGATAGLGRESARALASAGAQVIAAGRDPRALESTIQWVRQEVPGADVSSVVLDLASLESVRDAAESVSRRVDAIDVLINNAGVMFTPFGRTSDGFELQMGTNHLGHFELTRRLTPQLLRADGARVVILSSGGHVMGDVDLGDPSWETRPYDKFMAYGASKTANILFMVELDRRLRDYGVRAYSVNPGAVATSLARHMSRADFSALKGYAAASTAAKGNPTDGMLDFTMPEQGAATQVWAAVTPELEGRGALYLEECRVSDEVQPYALDGARARELWALSERLCGVPVRPA
ncbi:MAG: short-chain dehydrogenase/reductase [Nocardioides sp.]|nr:short-chain dehydrogenase/reductase [Nocardioides sp.]